MQLNSYFIEKYYERQLSKIISIFIQQSIKIIKLRTSHREESTAQQRSRHTHAVRHQHRLESIRVLQFVQYRRHSIVKHSIS